VFDPFGGLELEPGLPRKDSIEAPVGERVTRL
jgi:hypothetical protein